VATERHCLYRQQRIFDCACKAVCVAHLGACTCVELSPCNLPVALNRSGKKRRETTRESDSTPVAMSESGSGLDLARCSLRAANRIEHRLKIGALCMGSVNDPLMRFYS